MTSWRDSATQQAQDDLDGLLDVALPFAQQMLDEHGEFFPYGIALDESGEARMVSGDPQLGERPASTDVLATLIQRLRTERHSCCAVALVSDVRQGTTDAVRVELEHRDGHAVAVFIPYKKKRLGRRVDYGRPSAGPGSTQVWGT